MTDETIKELQKAYCELEKEFAKKNEKIAELKGEYELLLRHKEIEDKTIDLCAERCEALEQELSDWQDGTIIVKWCEAEEKNQALKDRWQKLKEFIQKDHDWNLERGNNDCALGQRWVLDKIEELEQEGLKQAREELGNEEII